jgi:hypothetical protein
MRRVTGETPVLISGPPLYVSTGERRSRPLATGLRGAPTGGQDFRLTPQRKDARRRSIAGSVLPAEIKVEPKPLPVGLMLTDLTRVPLQPHIVLRSQSIRNPCHDMVSNMLAIIPVSMPYNTATMAQPACCAWPDVLYVLQVGRTPRPCSPIRPETG